MVMNLGYIIRDLILQSEKHHYVLFMDLENIKESSYMYLNSLYSQ